MRILAITVIACLLGNEATHAQVAKWTVAPQLKIGAGATDPNYRMPYSTDVIRLGNGNIAASMYDQVRLFDATGKYLRTLTASGSASGGMEGVVHMQNWRGDSLAVFHRQTRDFFTSSGEFSRSETVHHLIGMQNLPIKPSSDGSLPTDRVLVSGETVGHYTDFTQTGQWGLTYQYLLTVPSGAVALTEIPAMAMQHNGTADNPSRPFEPVPFAAPAMVAVSDGLIFIATASKPEIQVFGFDGKAIRTIVLPRKAIAVTPADVEAYINLAVDFAAPEYREQRRSELLRLTPAAQMPYFSRMVAARDGNIWLGDNAWPRSDTVGWSVLTPEGREIARVMLPTRFSPRDIGSDFVLGSTSQNAGAGITLDLYKLSR